MIYLYTTKNEYEFEEIFIKIQELNDQLMTKIQPNVYDQNGSTLPKLINLNLLS